MVFLIVLSEMCIKEVLVLVVEQFGWLRWDVYVCVFVLKEDGW